MLSFTYGQLFTVFDWYQFALVADYGSSSRSCALDHWGWFLLRKRKRKSLWHIDTMMTRYQNASYQLVVSVIVAFCTLKHISSRFTWDTWSLITTLHPFRTKLKKKKMETYELFFPNHCSAMSLYMVYVSKCRLAYWRTFSLPGYCCLCTETYCRSFNITGTSVGNIMVDHSDVVGASPVGAAPTTSSFST